MDYNSKRKRLVVVDFNFTWPPDGGGAVDLIAPLSRYTRTFEVILLVPRIVRVWKRFEKPWPLSRTKFFLRGKVDDPNSFPFKIEFLDFDLSAFSPSNVAAHVRKKIDSLGADYVMVADVWYFRADTVLALADYKPVLRFYAYDTMCIKALGLKFRKGRECDVNYLDGSWKSYFKCVGCGASFYLTYPSPRWLYEFLRSKAFLKSYQKKCLDALNSAGKIIVCNNKTASWLKRFVKVPVQSVFHGIDIKRFSPLINKDFFSRPVKLLVAGRLDMEIKGVKYAIEACKELWKKRTDFVLKVVGSSDFPPLPFIERSKWVPYERVHEIYQQADICIVPSVWPDPFPQVTLEAMSCGLPVIGSAVGGIPEQFEDGVQGLLVPPADPKALADRIEWFLDHREKIKEFGERARKRAVDLFDADKVFDKFYSNLF